MALEIKLTATHVATAGHHPPAAPGDQDPAGFARRAGAAGRRGAGGESGPRGGRLDERETEPEDEAPRTEERLEVGSRDRPRSGRSRRAARDHHRARARQRPQRHRLGRLLPQPQNDRHGSSATPRDLRRREAAEPREHAGARPVAHRPPPLAAADERPRRGGAGGHRHADRQHGRGRVPPARRRGDRLPERQGLRGRRARAAAHPGARSAGGRRARSARMPAPAAARAAARRTRLADRIVRDHLPMLEGKRFDKIAKELGVHRRGGGRRGDGDRHARAEAGAQLRRRRRSLHHARRLRAQGRRGVRRDAERRRPAAPARQLVLPPGPRTAPAAARPSATCRRRCKSALWLIKSIQQRQRTLFMVTIEHRQVPARLPRSAASPTCSRWC